ncbi:MAG TPA: MFS transporter [Candidatus Binataceae bacterium]|nr:MFS transporter [Candidatus Binataceae bacterium]
MTVIPTESAGTPEPLPEFYDSAENRRRVRSTVWILMAMLVYQGYAGSIVVVASPWIAKGFGLSESALARVFAWLALAALGALGLSRMIDRAGRRRVLIWSSIAIPLAALGAAVSTRLWIFVACAIVMNAFLGAAAASAIVILAEVLPIARRADGQGWAGIAGAAGSGFCVFMMPIVISAGGSWRWLLVIAGIGLAIAPMVARINESERWKAAALEGGAARTHFYDVFVPLYRRRSATLIVCTALAAISGEGVNAWAYFHAVTTVGLSAAIASTLTIVSGGLGMIGFPLGAWAAERFGRVPTIVVSGIAVSILALGYFWGPPVHFAHPALWLGFTYLIVNACANALTVAANAAITELFPTELRATMIGWFALVGAGGALAAEATISILARTMGGISGVTGWLSLLGVPAAILFGIVIDETRGLSLEDSAKEDAFRAVP